MKFWDRKAKTYLVLGLAVLISIIHLWRPVFFSSTNSGDRAMFMVFIMLFALSAKNGSSKARIVIGVGYLFLSATNLLIAVFFNVSNGISNFVEILFWGLALGGIGLTLLNWKDIRVFEESIPTQKIQSI